MLPWMDYIVNKLSLSKPTTIELSTVFSPFWCVFAGEHASFIDHVTSGCVRCCFDVVESIFLFFFFALLYLSSALRFHSFFFVGLWSPIRITFVPLFGVQIVFAALKHLYFMNNVREISGAYNTALNGFVAIFSGPKPRERQKPKVQYVWYMITYSRFIPSIHFCDFIYTYMLLFFFSLLVIYRNIASLRRIDVMATSFR